MKINVISEKKNELEFELVGEDHTFSGLLVSKLLEDKDVDIAQYDILHPQISNPKFYVRTKKGKPRQALKKCLGQIKKEIKSLKVK